LFLFITQRQNGSKFLFLLIQAGNRKTPLMILKMILPLLIYEGLLTLFLQGLQTKIKFMEQQFLHLNTLADNLKFAKSLTSLFVKLSNTGNLINDDTAFTVPHFSNPGDVTLHHHIIPFSLYANFRQKFNNISLFAKAFVKVVVAVITVFRTLYPASYPGTI